MSYSDILIIMSSVSGIVAASSEVIQAVSVTITLDHSLQSGIHLRVYQGLLDWLVTSPELVEAKHLSPVFLLNDLDLLKDVFRGLSELVLKTTVPPLCKKKTKWNIHAISKSLSKKVFEIGSEILLKITEDLRSEKTTTVNTFTITHSRTHMSIN